MNILSANDIATTLKLELDRIYSELMESYKSNVKTSIDFEYDDCGFCITLPIDKDSDVEIIFNADVSTKDIYKGRIVEFTNISLVKVEVDNVGGTYCLDLDKSDALLEVGIEIALNASFYRLVDENTVTTDDLDVTYSEMSEQYEKYGY